MLVNNKHLFFHMHGMKIKRIRVCCVKRFYFN